ncbi:hypothetical protein CLIB1444_07S00474 [[Candida] jaroonii]|uniref:Uncharacterized protein n=1 Tax=[Candida] jaroonii TaxID=467808 RepID=A0ACA9YB85_9ASCO|nr:hypothetical protein CLIB1444_07S00474 [[Candida] jaroonii]
MIGKLIHYGADLVLVSTALAGLKRSSGLTPNLDSQSKDIQYYSNMYLDIGEKILDYSTAYCSSSDYFKRR